MSQSQTEIFDLPRADGLASVRVFISRPPGMDANAVDVPVLFVLDGDFMFDMAASIAHYRAVGVTDPDAIVVGVGYGADFLTVAKLRTADLTPPLSEEGQKTVSAVAGMIGSAAGGAEAFLAFILGAVAPEVSRRVPQASTTRQALFGHSLAGLFVAHALLRRPDAFSVFAVSSPSLWWDGFAFQAQLPALADRLKALSAPPRVFVDVGAAEQDVPTEVPAHMPMTLEQAQAMVAQARMVDAAADFAAELRRLGLADVEYAAFSDEGHMSVIPAALNRTITFAQKSWR